MPGDAQTVFLSYCRDDSDFAVRLARDLKNAGLTVWVDKLEIKPGSEWDRTVQDAVTSSSCVLVVLSPASAESKNVLNEISVALDNDIKVIPILYRKCKVPLRVARLNYID